MVQTVSIQNAQIYHKAEQKSPVLTVWSAYRPQPGRGESPTRPGDLKGAPDVETPIEYVHKCLS